MVRGSGLFHTFKVMAILVYGKEEVAYTNWIAISNLNALLINWSAMYYYM